MRTSTLDLEYWDGTLLILGWRGEVYRADAIPQQVWDELADESIAKVTYTDADHLFLAKNNDFRVRGPHLDARVMAWLINENEPDFSLEAMVKKYLGVDPDKRLKYAGNGTVKFRMDDGTMVDLADFVADLKGDYINAVDEGVFMSEAWDQFLAYCKRDIGYTEQLAEFLIGLLKRHNLYNLWRKVEVPFSDVITDMELNGVPIDLEEAKTLVEKFRIEADEREAKLLEDLGYEVNVGSWQQLGEVLYSDLWEQGVEYEMDEFKRAAIKKQRYVDIVHLNRCDAAEMAGEKLPTKKSTLESITREGFEAYRHDLVSTWFPAIDVQRIGTTKVAGTITRKGLGLKRPRKKKGQTTDAATASPILRKNFYDVPWVLDLLAWRKVTKAVQYIQSYQEHTIDGIMYGRFDRCGTVTGRLSSRDPNLMNIPSRGPMGAAIRGLFTGPGLIVGDHSQLEVRVLASFSQDPALLDIYRNGKDIYGEVGTNIFGMKVEKGMPERDIVAKNLVLGDAYGAGPETVHTQLLVLAHMVDPALMESIKEEYTVDRVSELQDELHRMFRVAESWKQFTVDEARETGYVTTIGGRLRRIDQSQRRTWRNDFFSREDRQAVNSRIQGSAADILQDNMLSVRRQVPEVKQLVQVHDELVMQQHDFAMGAPAEWPVQETLDRITHVCENPRFRIDCPLKFDPALVDSWADKA